jgi:hypothetical protein
MTKYYQQVVEKVIQTVQRLKGKAFEPKFRWVFCNSLLVRNLKVDQIVGCYCGITTHRAKTIL